MKTWMKAYRPYERRTPWSDGTPNRFPDNIRDLMNLKHDEISNLVWDFPFLRRYLDGFDLNTKRFFRDIESGYVVEEVARPVLVKMTQLRPALHMDLMFLLQVPKLKREEYYNE